MSEVTKEESKEVEKSECNERLETIVVENKLSGSTTENGNITGENKKGIDGTNLTGEGGKLPHVEIEIHEEDENNEENKNVSPPQESIPEIFIKQPLCADYGSSTDTESDTDSSSESDSDSSTVDSDTDSSSQVSSDDLQDINDGDINGVDKSCKKTDLDLSDLPPIENLRISVPEEECQEIGVISSIVNTLVVVQAYKDTPALDIDTVLFLDMGQKSLGRIFDVLGPVSEPVYAVRFNNAEEIAENNIAKGQKVFCAPKTEYTSLVFISELMKMKGSDASWKDNEEAPPEHQDFSDDEQEHKFRFGGKSSNNPQRPSPSDDGIPKRGKIDRGKPNFAGKAGNYRNPFALGHSRNRRYNQRGPGRHPPRYPPGNYSNSSQLPYPDQTNQFYDSQNNFHRGGMMGQPPLPPPYPNYPNYSYPYQQYPSYPRQQFAMPGVMPPPPPPPSVSSNQSNDNRARTQNLSRMFGSNMENPPENG